MAKKALTLDANGMFRFVDVFLEEADASVTSASSKLVRGTTAGSIDPSWITTVPFSALPVAADGENSATKVVRADDSRLSNPTLNGDVTGTASFATVVALRNRAIPSTTPTDGVILQYNQASNSWVYATVATGSSLTVKDSTTTVTSVNELIFSSITNNGGGSVTVNEGSGGGGVGSVLYLFEHFT